MGRASGDKDKRRAHRLSGPELLDHLRDRLELLVRSCAGYDTLHPVESRNLAVGLRVLVHDTRRSTSIFQQLRVKKSMRFEDSCGPPIPGLVLSPPGLVILSPGSAWGDWVPLYERRNPFPPPIAPDLSPKLFDSWWSEPVLEDESKSVFSRRRLVLTLSDQDGGAHVDPGLDEDYAALSRGNSLGWTKSSTPVAEPLGMPLDSPVPASVRQIAHEMVRSCQWWLADALQTAGTADDDTARVLAPLDAYRSPYDPNGWDPNALERPPER